MLGDIIKCGKASVDGRMYKVNEFYTGFVEGSEGKTVGDVYLIDPAVFPELDEFEGEEYIRRKIRTSTDLECWIYEYKYDTKGIQEIKGGDWLLR
jgi:gamma-glutamylcyclotransferase (GGCT)/AIG2-like uncharacterized protein YtfP